MQSIKFNKKYSLVFSIHSTVPANKDGKKEKEKDFTSKSYLRDASHITPQATVGFSFLVFMSYWSSFIKRVNKFKSVSFIKLIKISSYVVIHISLSATMIKKFLIVQQQIFICLQYIILSNLQNINQRIKQERSCRTIFLDNTFWLNKIVID